MSENNDKHFSEDEAKEILRKKEEEGGAFKEDEPTDNEPKSLGKIDVNPDVLATKQASRDLIAQYGEKEFFVEDLPSKGLFYPFGTKMYIRAAETEQIKHYSTMDERDLIDIEDKLNDIINKGLRIKVPSSLMSYKDLLEEDRIKLILAIKDYTFKQGENVIKFDMQCDKCSHANELTLNNSILSTHSLPESIMKYYDETARMFIVKTKSYGEIKLRPPSIGIMQVIYQYIREKDQNKEKWDKSFMQILPYTQLDWRGFNDKSLFDSNVEYAGWDKTKYALVYRMAEDMKLGIKPDIEIECESCGAEVTAPIKFPGGLKSLFIVSDFSGELL